MNLFVEKIQKMWPQILHVDISFHAICRYSFTQWNWSCYKIRWLQATRTTFPYCNRFSLRLLPKDNSKMLKCHKGMIAIYNFNETIWEKDNNLPNTSTIRANGNVTAQINAGNSLNRKCGDKPFAHFEFAVGIPMWPTEGSVELNEWSKFNPMCKIIDW